VQKPDDISGRKQGNSKMRTTKIMLGAGLAAMMLASGCTDNTGVNAATGAVVGGVIGNQIGNGTGNTIATIGGAAAGAAIAANRTP
jgi:outer membrane lipoprotein SlyB